MGGLFIIVAVVMNMVLWSYLRSSTALIFLVTLLGFGAIGFWDDWSKIYYKKGISARHKFWLQWAIAAVVATLLIYVHDLSTTLTIPGLWQIDLGLFYIPWIMFILVGCSNAVNLTDGLDGLATGSLIPTFLLFTMLSFCSGYLELATIGCILIGSLVGFLWYNAYPAQIFMGDVGSLALGASLALMAIMTKYELLLPIAGGIFVVEALSVMIQLFVFRRFGTRIFKMAPIHHHFELIGWPETKITVRFTIVSCMLCVLALLALGSFIHPVEYTWPVKA